MLPYTEKSRDELIALLKERDREDRQHDAGAVLFDLEIGYCLHEAVVDAHGHLVDYLFLEANDRFLNHVGMLRENVLGRRVSELFAQREPIWFKAYETVRKTGEPTTFSFYSELVDGSFEVTATSPRAGVFATVFRDLSLVLQREQKASRMAAVLNSLFNASDDVIFFKDTEGRYQFVNKAVTKVGKTLDALLGRTDIEIFPPELAQRFAETDRLAMETGETQCLQSVIPRAGLEDVVLETVKVPVFDEAEKLLGTLGVGRDVSARLKQEQIVRAALREKDILLKEVHHRVKNNMQIISSLMSLQADSVSDPGIVGLLIESQSRVRAMAAVHERLYLEEDLSRVDFHSYLQSVCSNLSQGYGNMRERVRVHTDARGVLLSIEDAIPCGLIVNELLTNAYKHAFPGEQRGTVNVYMAAPDKDIFRLEVRDDGCGLPEAFNASECTSLGMQLILSLADQLDGSIQFGDNPECGSSCPGTSIVLEFPFDAESGKIASSTMVPEED